jgi:hypothetical protein
MKWIVGTNLHSLQDTSVNSLDRSPSHAPHLSLQQRRLSSNGSNSSSGDSFSGTSIPPGPGPKHHRPRLMPLKIPPPQGFSALTQDSEDILPQGPGAPPAIRVHKTSPPDNLTDLAADEAANRLNRTSLHGPDHDGLKRLHFET